MMMRSRFLISLVVMGLSLSALVAVAQTPVPFDQEGVIDAIYLDEGRLVIYDVNYHFPKSARVYYYDPTTEQDKPKTRTLVSAQSLAPGKRVGFTALYRSGKHRFPVIKAIWILGS